MTDAPAAPAPRRSIGHRALRIAAWTLAVLLVLAGAVALFLPGYLKGVAVEQIREQLHREATVESITVNPFLMSVRVKALAINDRDSKSNLLKFDELYTRIGLSSIFHAAPVIEELTLTKPRIDLTRLAEGRYNVSDIIDLLLAGPPDPKGPRFALNSLTVSDAEIVFDDRPAGKIHKIEKLHIALPMLSSFEDERQLFAEPSLTAMVNGEPLELTGRTKPFDASLETIVSVRLSDVDIAGYLPYSPVRLPWRLQKGRLSTALDVSIVRGRDKSVSASVKGTARVDDLLLRDVDAGDDTGPVASLRSIDVKIRELKWPDNTVQLDSVAIDGPQVWVRRERNGTINWQNMIAKLVPAAPERASAARVQTATTPPRPLRFSIDDAQLANGLVLFEDLAAPAGSFKAVTSPIAVHVRNLSNVEGAEAAIEASLVTDGNEQIVDRGKLTLAPLTASGELSVKAARLNRYQPYYGDTLAADLDGLADVDARFALAADGNLKVDELRVNGTGISLKDKARGEVARIANVALSGGEVDLAQRAVAIGALSLTQCRVAVVRDRASRLNLAALIKSAGSAPAGPMAAAAPAVAAASSRAEAPSTAGAAAKDWVVAVKQASLERCAIQFDDQRAAQDATAKIVLDPLDARIEGWSTRPDSRARIDVRTRVNGGGQVAAKGTAVATPLAADLDIAVDGLDIAPLQPYAADRLNIRITSGIASTHGKLTLRDGTPVAIRYRGEAALARLASATKADGEDFLNWGSLKATGLDVSLNAPARAGAAAGIGAAATVPLTVALDELALSDFYSRLIVNADGTLNVQHIVREAGADPAASSAAAAGSTAPASASGSAAAGATAPASASGSAAGTAQAVNANAAPPPPVTINKVTLASGRVNFSDHFIKPNYSADIADVNGAISGLSSDFASRANVDIKGRYDPSAPVEIKGTINPLSGNLFLDIAASCRDVELVPFTPYAQKYAGYGINKGKLSLQVKYLIEDRKLTADNTLLLDQLTFGDKVESPDATKLPVLFAVSLLKNSKGEIDLNLPISGSLDDPQFSVFGIVLKIIGNLLVKAATSPFALIGALAGGSGEDLAYVDFPAGAASTFAAGQEDKLAKIAKALNERPGLRLDIAGRVDPTADSSALLKRALTMKLVALRQDDALATGEAGASAEAPTILPAEYPVLLKRAYDGQKSADPKNAAGAAQDPPPAEMEKVLLAAITVSPDEIRELGERRANAAKNALQRLGVAGERMFIVAAAGGGEAKPAPRVDFVLK